MSWDVVIFRLNRKVDSVEEINETILVDIGTRSDFKGIIEDNFPKVTWDEHWEKIEGEAHSIEFSLGTTDEPFSNAIFHLYGENAIYDIVRLCRRMNWQAYDTGLDQMLDLENPERNGYQNFQNYLRQILREN
jgi:hypothetical protein